MHQFWNSMYKHDTFYRFNIDKKKRFKLTLEVFRDIFQICPRVLGRDFDPLPSEEDTVSFLRELGHTRGEVFQVWFKQQQISSSEEPPVEPKSIKEGKGNRQDLGFIPSGNVVLSSTYVGKILGADQLLVILCYRYQESGIGYWILSMTISGSGVMAAPTIPVSAEENLGDSINIRMDIIHPEPVTVVAFPAAVVVRTQAQYGEAIRGIQEHLLRVPIQEELTALRFRVDIAEAENASLRVRIKTMEAIEKITRNCERQARIKIEQQLA
ncbi:hypothetical protein Tco_0053123, partial [Tanacetum coccineum]